MSRQNGVGESLTAYWHTRGFRTTKWTKISSSWLQQWRRWVSHTPSTECIVGWTISSRALAGALWDTSAIVDHVTAMHSVIGNWKKKKKNCTLSILLYKSIINATVKQEVNITHTHTKCWMHSWLSNMHQSAGRCSLQDCRSRDCNMLQNRKLQNTARFQSLLYKPIIYATVKQEANITHTKR